LHNCNRGRMGTRGPFPKIRFVSNLPPIVRGGFSIGMYLNSRRCHGLRYYAVRAQSTPPARDGLGQGRAASVVPSLAQKWSSLGKLLTQKITFRFFNQTPVRKVNHEEDATAEYTALTKTPLVVSCQGDEIDEAVLEFLNGNGESEIIGLDIEARPSFSAKERNRTALIQLASEGGCLLAHVENMAQLPRQLQRVLEDKRVLKVGTGVNQDMKFIRKDFGVNASGYVDTGVVAELFSYNRIGLKSMVGEFGLEMVKAKDIQISRWDSWPLSAEQIQYAAQDARMSLWLLRQLYRRHNHDSLTVLQWCSAFANQWELKDMFARARSHPFLLPPAVLATCMELEQRMTEESEQRRLEKIEEAWQIAIEMEVADGRSAVSKLHELAQVAAVQLNWEVKECIREDKPPEPEFTATPVLGGCVLTSGSGQTNKRLAKHAAAAASINLLKTEPLASWRRKFAIASKSPV